MGQRPPHGWHEWQRQCVRYDLCCVCLACRWQFDSFNASSHVTFILRRGKRAGFTVGMLTSPHLLEPLDAIHFARDNATLPVQPEKWKVLEDEVKEACGINHAGYASEWLALNASPCIASPLAVRYPICISLPQFPVFDWDCWPKDWQRDMMQSWGLRLHWQSSSFKWLQLCFFLLDSRWTWPSLKLAWEASEPTKGGSHNIPTWQSWQRKVYSYRSRHWFLAKQAQF